MKTQHISTINLHRSTSSALAQRLRHGVGNSIWLSSVAGLTAVYSAAGMAAQFSGAIFTSKADGTNTNANIYTSKEDVFLNGGPQNANSAGLPFDNLLGEAYYFQVTDPSDKTLLSTDDAECRQVLVAPSSISGKGVIYGTAPVPASCTPHALGSFNPANGSIPVGLFPYENTPNSGGEYKLWLIRKTGSTSVDPNDSKVLRFSNSDTKTDNFKVRQAPPPPELEFYSIEGTKFYDSNVNGVRDASEPGIAGYHIELFGLSQLDTSTAIEPRGMYSFQGLATGEYGVCEMIPEGGQKWYSTTAAEISPIAVGPDSIGNDFGNVCIAGGNGRTLGFWSNPNGEKAFASAGASNLGGLTVLNLRKADGAIFDPTSYKLFKSWLLSATATNMAYMLSAQMSAMWLNVNVGGPDGKVADSTFVHAGTAPVGCTVAGLSPMGFISISALITAANASLADPNGLTIKAGTVRSCQEFLKNALDDGNNNRNFVGSPAQCTVDYSGMEAPCTPP